MTRAILGPLTTAFTPSPSCTSLIASAGALAAYQAQSCHTASSFDDHTACWPAAERSDAPTPTLPLMGWGFYSPGLECPTGHYTACLATAGLSGTWDPQFSLTSRETAAGCCPSGYTCASVFTAGTCRMLVTQSVVETAACEDGTLGAPAPLAVPTTSLTGGFFVTDGEEATDAAVTITAYELFAPLIQLNFQSSDLATPSSSLSSTTPSASSAAPSRTSDGSGSRATAEAAPSTGSGGGGGLSTGAKAGIGIGAAVAALAAAAAVFFLLRRRKARPAQPDSTVQYYPVGSHTPLGELEYKQGPAELMGRQMLAELPVGEAWRT